MTSFELFAAAGYLAYWARAGGVNFDGKPLPTWGELGADRQACFVDFTKAVLGLQESIH